jgi:hypothetical protein
MIPVIDPYDYLINMRWFPSCGEVTLNPYQSGSKVNIITRGAFITDNEGHLISNSPEETQAVCNSIQNTWEYVVTDIKNRKESGLPFPFPLISFTILFDRENNNNIIKYNDECCLNVSALLKPNIPTKKGENIYFDQIFDIKKVIPPSLNNLPVAFCMYKQNGKQISLYFDFRPNDSVFRVEDWKDEDIWLADAYLETHLANTYGHLSLLIPQLRNYDIPFTIGPSSKKTKKILKLIKEAKTSDDLNKRLSTVLTIKEVDLLVSNWVQLEAFVNRKELLLEAFKCFKHGIHSGVITILMSQVEGVITEELISKQKGIDKKGKSKPWTTKIDEFFEIVTSENIGPMTLRILVGLVTFLKDSNLYRGFSWTEENKGINRHASLHGKDSSYNSRANSIRMILLFDSLYWIFLALQTFRSQNS